jgi:protein EFR3
LQILTALMEKAPRDLPLYSNCILTILETVLKSEDINMVEESLPTFETYCKYQDVSSLASDQHSSQQYQNIVHLLASFASSDFPSFLKQKPSKPMAMRWKTAGLRAIRSVVGAEALGTDSSMQLSIVVPVILESLYTENDDILASLQEKAQTGEKTDVENARKRRMSIATVTTVDTVDANPASASETTADADKVAEDEVRVLAVRCLKQIFAAGTGSNRGQVRLATMLMLKFITDQDPPALGLTDPTSKSGRRGNWATSLIETVARWTPVQDRFIIVTTAVDALIKSPMEETKLKQQLTLATMIDSLLSSSINLIGLSVMDVLLGFVQHVLLLLQLGGRGSKIKPHHPQSDPLEEVAQVIPEKERGRSHATSVTTPSQVRQELLLQLQKCIGDLATHIYYTDQISDMMSAILARLKPSSNSEISSTAAAIENPAAAANAIANSVNLQEDPLTDGFFSFATARISALRAVKHILLVANMRKSLTGVAAEARSRVGVQVWEGTQWLLRDDDREVRAAYVDALLTWLKLETNKSDLLLPREGSRKSKISSKRGRTENGELKLAKRAVSNASWKENKKAKSAFLQLLHLAIYDNAIENPRADSDILLLYLLLTNLAERLGVNAVRHGLPMIARLQDDLESGEIFRNAKAQINIASLVHGYFWALSEKFDFETSRVGNQIHSEISRRKKNELWLDKIRLPALPLEHIIISSFCQTEKGPIVPKITNDSFRPHKARADLVEEICTSYNNSLMTPATSPPASPGRVFSVPALSFGYGYSLNPGPKPSPEDEIPQKIKDELLAEWSKHSVIAAVEKERSESLSGSKTGTGSARVGRNFLTVDNLNGGGRGMSQGASDSPTRAANERDGQRMSGMSYALNGGLGNLQRPQRTGTDEGSPTPLTPSSSRDSTVRVSELKRALSGHQNNLRHSSPLRMPMTGVRDSSVASAQSRASSGSESMVSYNEVEGGANSSALGLNAVEHSDFAMATDTRRRQGSDDPAGRKSSSPNSQQSQQQRVENGNGIHTAPTLPRLKSDPRLGEDVPPVPKIPSSLNLPGTYPREISPARPSSSQDADRQPQPRAQNPMPRPSTAPGTACSELAPPHTQIQEDSLYPTSTPLGSTREGRTMRRAKPAGRWPPGSRTSYPDFSARTTRGSSRVDLRKLLEGITTNGDDDDANGDEVTMLSRSNGNARAGGYHGGHVGVALRPPY